MEVKRSKKLICVLVALAVLVFFVGAAWYVSWLESQPQTPEPVPWTSSSQTSSVVSQPSSGVSSQTGSPASQPSQGVVEEITLTTYQVDLSVGESEMPIVTMYPLDAPDQGEIWTSSDTSVAVVSDLGLITGVGEGSCIVTVVSTDNPSVSASVAVTVE